MSHDGVYGICQPNKCLVEVAPKEDVDAMKEKLDNIEVNDGTLVIGGEFRGYLYLLGEYDTSGDIEAYTCPEVSLGVTGGAQSDRTSDTITVPNYTTTLSFPLKISHGVYIKSLDDISDGNVPSVATRTGTLSLTNNYSYGGATNLYVDGVLFKTLSLSGAGTASEEVEIPVGSSIYMVSSQRQIGSLVLNEEPTMYIKVL